uniref:Glycosyltransferase family 1 protein n=1 Tax=candidate division WOR-3 bacterium TaxID=2052148 RepID=A0A7V3ZTH1_UNCW3
MSSSKIVYISTAFPRYTEDRINPWLFETIKRLKEKKYKIKVFTSSYKGIKQKEINGIEIYRFRYLPKNIEILTHDVAVPERWKMGIKYRLMIIPYILSGIINSLIFALRENFDIIHVHWPFPHIIFGLIMKIIKQKPLICSFHGGEIIFLENMPLLFRGIFKLLFNFSEFYTVNSSFTKEKLLKFIGKKKSNKIFVIPFGITLREPKEEIEKIKKEKIKILFAGRLIERKGVHFLLESFTKVNKIFPQTELVIAGDGPWREKLEILANLLGIKDKVIFKGYLKSEELEKEYREADIFVLPSIHDVKGDTETLGVVLIEAMEYGVPVVATNVGGIPDIVIDGYNGLLVSEKNSDALADAIIKLIEDNKLREKFVKNAKKYIKEKFGWDNIIKKLIKIYIDLTKMAKKK